MVSSRSNNQSVSEWGLRQRFLTLNLEHMQSCLRAKWGLPCLPSLSTFHQTWCHAWGIKPFQNLLLKYFQMSLDQILRHLQIIIHISLVRGSAWGWRGMLTLGRGWEWVAPVPVPSGKITKGQNGKRTIHWHCCYFPLWGRLNLQDAHPGGKYSFPNTGSSSDPRGRWSPGASYYRQRTFPPP